MRVRSSKRHQKVSKFAFFLIKFLVIILKNHDPISYTYLTYSKAVRVTIKTFHSKFLNVLTNTVDMFSLNVTAMIDKIAVSAQADPIAVTDRIKKQKRMNIFLSSMSATNLRK